MRYDRLANIDSLPANAALGKYVFKKELDGTYTTFLILADEDDYDLSVLRNSAHPQQPDYFFVAA